MSNGALRHDSAVDVQIGRTNERRAGAKSIENWHVAEITIARFQPPDVPKDFPNLETEAQFEKLKMTSHVDLAHFTEVVDHGDGP